MMPCWEQLRVKALMASLSLTNEKPGIYCLLQTGVTLTAANAFFFFFPKLDSSALANIKTVAVKKKTQHQKGGQILHG